MRTIAPHGTLDIPESVAVCPYCGAKLIAQPTAWEQDDDGTWYATETGLECTAAPELDEDAGVTEAFDEWLASHTVMPYVYWLPVDVKVQAWMKRKFRFEM